MVTIPQTPITEQSFNKWKCHKVNIVPEEETDEKFWYWVIPLIDLPEEKFQDESEWYPHFFSSENGEFEDDHGIPVYSVFLFDDDLPALTTEEEVEIVYRILTKKELYV